MKYLEYDLKVCCTPAEVLPTEYDRGGHVSVPYSEEAFAIAQAEAWPDTLEIVEDGQPEPAAAPSAEDTLLELMADHEYRLCMLELGS